MLAYSTRVFSPLWRGQSGAVQFMITQSVGELQQEGAGQDVTPKISIFYSYFYY